MFVSNSIMYWFSPGKSFQNKRLRMCEFSPPKLNAEQTCLCLVRRYHHWPLLWADHYFNTFWYSTAVDLLCSHCSYFVTALQSYSVFLMQVDMSFAHSMESGYQGYVRVIRFGTHCLTWSDQLPNGWISLPVTQWKLHPIKHHARKGTSNVRDWGHLGVPATTMVNPNFQHSSTLGDFDLSITPCCPNFLLWIITQNRTPVTRSIVEWITTNQEIIGAKM